jgi:hypothetical protein
MNIKIKQKMEPAKMTIIQGCLKQGGGSEDGSGSDGKPHYYSAPHIFRTSAISLILYIQLSSTPKRPKSNALIRKIVHIDPRISE